MEEEEEVEEGLQIYTPLKRTTKLSFSRRKSSEIETEGKKDTLCYRYNGKLRGLGDLNVYACKRATCRRQLGKKRQKVVEVGFMCVFWLFYERL